MLGGGVRLGGARVLIVEDDADTRELLAELLGSHGAIVSVAGSGQEAFVAFERDRPSLVLSDLWMPNGDGFELAQRIRALPPERGGLTPAIAMSAAEHARRAILAGFHAFFAKPFDIDRVVATIADFLDEPEASDGAASWTIARRPGTLVLTFSGHVSRADFRAMMRALEVHLREGPVAILDDLRRLETFAPSVASVGERAVWTLRGNILSVHVLGGTTLARLVTEAACKLLRIPCTFDDG